MQYYFTEEAKAECTPQRPSQKRQTANEADMCNPITSYQMNPLAVLVCKSKAGNALMGITLIASLFLSSCHKDAYSGAVFLGQTSCGHPHHNVVGVVVRKDVPVKKIEPISPERIMEVVERMTETDGGLLRLEPVSSKWVYYSPFVLHVPSVKLTRISFAGQCSNRESRISLESCKRKFIEDSAMAERTLSTFCDSVKPLIIKYLSDYYGSRVHSTDIAGALSNFKKFADQAGIQQKIILGSEYFSFEIGAGSEYDMILPAFSSDYHFYQYPAKPSKVKIDNTSTGSVPDVHSITTVIR